MDACASFHQVSATFSNLYLSKLLNVFVQNANCICTNCKVYFCKDAHVSFHQTFPGTLCKLCAHSRSPDGGTTKCRTLINPSWLPQTHKIVPRGKTKCWSSGQFLGRSAFGRLIIESPPLTGMQVTALETLPCHQCRLSDAVSCPVWRFLVRFSVTRMYPYTAPSQDVLYIPVHPNISWHLCRMWPLLCHSIAAVTKRGGWQNPAKGYLDRHKSCSKTRSRVKPPLLIWNLCIWATGDFFPPWVKFVSVVGSAR